MDFFVGAGDNFYYRGVKTVDDFRFNATFEKVYNSASLQKKWYMIAGNHDYYGNVSAQILYSKKSNRWTFPYFYYTKGLLNIISEGFFEFLRWLLQFLVQLKLISCLKCFAFFFQIQFLKYRSVIRPCR